VLGQRLGAGKYVANEYYVATYVFITRPLGLILNIVGTGIFLFVLLRLAAIIRADWDDGFPSWRRWLIVAGVAVVLGVALLAFS
jgi:hypothetical protein